MDPASLPQLAHPSIDDRIAGHALLPAFEIPFDQVSGVRIAPQSALVVIAIAVARIIGELADDVLGIIAPDDLLGENLPPDRSLVLQRVPDLHRADFAPMEVRRQAAGPVDRGEIARLVILGDRIGPSIEAIVRGVFAHLPEIANAARPVGLGR